jgi:hypothetical protein
MEWRGEERRGEERRGEDGTARWQTGFAESHVLFPPSLLPSLVSILLFGGFFFLSLWLLVLFQLVTRSGSQSVSDGPYMFFTSSSWIINAFRFVWVSFFRFWFPIGFKLV